MPPYPTNWDNTFSNLGEYTLKRSSDGESLYETYQSIFVHIIGDHDFYEKLCKMYEISHHRYKKYEKEITLQEIEANPLSPPGSRHVICQEKESTHYIAYIKGDNEYNPYQYYQIKDSHGYCQMFAFFLALEYGNGKKPKEIPNLQLTKLSTPISTTEFDKYVCNTAECGKAAIKIIEADLKDDFKILFNKEKKNKRKTGKPPEFNPLYRALNEDENGNPKKPPGVGFEVEKYFQDFEKLLTSQHVKYYIWDVLAMNNDGATSPIVGIRSVGLRSRAGQGEQQFVDESFSKYTDRDIDCDDPSASRRRSRSPNRRRQSNRSPQSAQSPQGQGAQSPQRRGTQSQSPQGQGARSRSPRSRSPQGQGARSRSPQSRNARSRNARSRSAGRTRARTRRRSGSKSPTTAEHLAWTSSPTRRGGKKNRH